MLVKAKSKTNKSTQSEEEIKYGSLEGNITFHYNRYRGYVSDTGAKVFVINKKENVVVGKGTVDGSNPDIRSTARKLRTRTAITEDKI